MSKIFYVRLSHIIDVLVMGDGVLCYGELEIVGLLLLLLLLIIKTIRPTLCYVEWTTFKTVLTSTIILQKRIRCLPYLGDKDERIVLQLWTLGPNSDDDT